MNNTSPLGEILIVDSDTNIAELLKINFCSEGFDVSIHPIASEFSMEDCENARMIIVDAMEQQDYTGIDLIADLKSNSSTAEIPIIMCASRGGADLMLEAFDVGADDFLMKPFSLRELVARAKAVLRRHPVNLANPQLRGNSASSTTTSSKATQNSSVITISSIELTIDTNSHRVVESDVLVPLTKTEYSILVFLIRHRNTFFTRDQICEEIWSEEAGLNSRIVDTNISRLRKKLGETGRHIINRYGQGYSFLDKID